MTQIIMFLDLLSPQRSVSLSPGHANTYHDRCSYASMSVLAHTFVSRGEIRPRLPVYGTFVSGSLGF